MTFPNKEGPTQSNFLYSIRKTKVDLTFIWALTCPPIKWDKPTSLNAEFGTEIKHIKVQDLA